MLLKVNLNAEEKIQKNILLFQYQLKRIILVTKSHTN